MKIKKQEISKDIVYDVEAIYLGARVDDITNSIYYFFRDHAGNIYRYKGLKNYLTFGKSYLVSKEGTISKIPNPCENQTLETTEQDLLDFHAHQNIVIQFRNEKKKTMHLKKPHKDIIEAIRLLRPFAKNLNYSDLKRFGEYLKNEISKKGKK